MTCTPTDLLWPVDDSPADLAAIESEPLRDRALPATTYDTLLRAARLWPDRPALAEPALHGHRSVRARRVCTADTTRMMVTFCVADGRRSLHCREARNGYNGYKRIEKRPVSIVRGMMSVSVPSAGCRSHAFDTLAVAVLDNRGTVLRWTGPAADLTGLTAGEVCGRPVQELLDHPPCELKAAAQVPASGQVQLRHRSGAIIEVVFRATPVEGSADVLVMAAPARQVADQEHGAALLRALSSQDRIGIVLLDADLAVVHANALPGVLDGARLRPGTRLREVLSGEDAEHLEAALRQVLQTGTPVIGSDQQVSGRDDPGRQWALSLSAFRLQDSRGHPTGVAALYCHAADQPRSRRLLDAAREAAERVGESLDVRRAAQELADVLVPAFGDFVAVDLAQEVFDGDEPPKRLGGGDLHLRNAAMAPRAAAWRAGIKRDDPLPPIPDHPRLRALQQGQTVVLGRDDYLVIGDLRLIEFLVPEHCDAVMVAPLHARGLTLGDISAWRVGPSPPFTQQEVDLLTQIAAWGALAIDNARRYTREHRAAVALQQRLLPPATTDTAAAETAGVYLPAGGGADISGDWFDAIALPSLRLALVAGDVVGHGMTASATMGRLRAAIQTLADLELDPDELLTRIADLVQRLTAEASPGDADTVGATCLYAVYDPVARTCTLASAGHPPPAVVRPDGTAEALDISAGPPLAIAGMPYEITTIDIEPGSVLALYTDGLIERDDGDIDQGLRRLTDTLAASCRPDRALEEIGRALVADLAERPLRDDVALLLARTRAVPAQDTASWQFPADPATVAEIRASTAHQLNAWGLDDLLFTTELIVSELVTNAIRYGRPPMGLRLIRHDNLLVCEVTDSSATQPRLRRARSTDEGGRGLFLVAQLTARWGCRYGQGDKTIWAEQLTHGPAGPSSWGGR